MKIFLSQAAAGVTSGFPQDVNGIYVLLEFYIAYSDKDNQEFTYPYSSPNNIQVIKSR